MIPGITFDDITLIPARSDTRSRTDPSLSIKTSIGLPLELPVVSSPMDTVTESKMARSMAIAGGLGIIHRFCPIDKQVQMVQAVRSHLYVMPPDPVLSCGAAIGMSGDYYERAIELEKAGANLLCIDVAHGHHVMMIEALQKLRKGLKSTTVLMAGNVATASGFQDLADAGADCIRVGVGGGSICSTRLETGFGVPQLYAMMEITRTEAYSKGTKLVLDGGIRTDGDIVKAFVFGAHAVMLGSMLAGTDQAPGDLFETPEGKRKVYRGMASKEAQQDAGVRSSAPEGISTTVPYKGDVTVILERIRGHLFTALSYGGVKDIKDLTSVEWVRQSPAAVHEAFTHILSRG
jgi:IMP dehydrogenase